MDRDSIIRQAVALARQQSGVVTRAQLLGMHMSPRAINNYVAGGLWRRIDRGTFWTAMSEPTWLALVWSAVFAGGDDAVLAGTTAAHLHGLIDEKQLPIVVMIPQHRRATARPYASYTRIDMDSRRYRNRSGLRCVGVEDTVLDLCDAATRPEVIGWVTAAAQRRLTTPQRLAKALARRRSVGHRKLIEKLIDDVGAGAQSVLEIEYVHRVERPHGLPVARRQVHAGSANQWVDNFYDEFGLVVELDGQKWHPEAFRDRARDNLNTRAGHSTLRYGSVEIFGESCGVAAEIGGELMRRGWAGTLCGCAKCP